MRKVASAEIPFHGAHNVSTKIGCLPSTPQEEITHRMSSNFLMNIRFYTKCLNLGGKFRLKNHPQASSDTSHLLLCHTCKRSEQMSGPAPFMSMFNVHSLPFPNSSHQGSVHQHVCVPSSFGWCTDLCK